MAACDCRGGAQLVAAAALKHSNTPLAPLATKPCKSVAWVTRWSPCMCPHRLRWRPCSAPRCRTQAAAACPRQLRPHSMSPPSLTSTSALCWDGQCNACASRHATHLHLLLAMAKHSQLQAPPPSSPAAPQWLSLATQSPSMMGTHRMPIRMRASGVLNHMPRV